MNHKGKLVRWNEDRGFGFIKSDSFKSDIFIHISALGRSSRKPIVGDLIYFDVVNDKDGKEKAENARIDGVRVEVNYTKSNKNNNSLLTIIPIVLLVLVCSYIYKAYLKPAGVLPTVFKEEDFSEFSCQGKQHCSEMKSCKEARFYLQNCPNMKIDGDNDGVPCEIQWCD
jgi:cold shock CspA family protein